MKNIPDWKWKTALAAFVLVTAVVVFWPLPDPPPPPPPPPESSRLAEEPFSTDDMSGTAAQDGQRCLAEEPFSTDDMFEYTVREDDTPESIARLFVIRLDDLMAANRMPLSGDFEPGRRIVIPPPRAD